MKKLITFLFLNILLICSIQCAEQKIGIIDDPFFCEGHTIVTIRKLIPHDTKVMALVDASNYARSEHLVVEPLYEKSWKHFDDRLISQECFHATVVCGPKIVEADLLKPHEYNYTLLREVEHRNGELAVNSIVTVCLAQEYERPDKTIYRKEGKVLYTLEMKRETINSGAVSLCHREWSILSKWEKKLRHATSLYNCFEVYHITTKETFGAVPGGAPKREETERLYVRRELKLVSTSPEGPQCGTLGRNLPGGYVII